MITIKPSINNQNISFQNNSKSYASKPKGYLVKENPVQSLKSSVKEYADISKYTVNALQSKGDDYSVGKINDLAIRVGSLGIAAVLASMTKNKALKVMEFAGFASFFAAMSIWPKLFIEAPLKAKTGFNVNQEYVDSYGRRKRFFEDPQYLAWDLYNSEELNKIGNKLKIPQNIENREKHIKAKMQQIAVQSNTLWMLTAGFATPLMASLMGNYISKYVNNVIETSRVKSALKSAEIKDFTKETDSILKKVFLNPIANLISLKESKTNLNTPIEKLKKLDNAYDAIFGKSDDAEYEYNKARLLYENVSDDKMLTQYDAKLGAITIKDSQGNVERIIKTKNVDGISTFGNKWQEIPNKIANALGITPKKYKKLMEDVFKIKEGNMASEDYEILTNMLIKNFAGAENKGKLQKTLNQIQDILSPSIKELNNAQKVFKEELNIIDAGSEINEYIKNIQLTRLTNKVVNTKSSWFAPVRILDIIAQYSDKPSAEVLNSSELKETLKQFIYGVTPHQINNNFDDVIKGDFSDEYRYTLGIDKFFAPLSGKTKKMFENGNKFINEVEANVKWLNKRFHDISGEKGKHFEAICEWLGKTPVDFISDATKQTGIYKGWLKKVGIAFATLTGITWFAISQFGKTNKYNHDMYKYKNEPSEGV